MSDRYHLTLTVGGRPAMHGWWASKATAERHFKGWVGEYGQPGARITLVDEEAGETLTEWPEPSRRPATLPA